MVSIKASLTFNVSCDLLYHLFEGYIYINILIIFDYVWGTQFETEDMQK